MFMKLQQIFSPPLSTASPASALRCWSWNVTIGSQKPCVDVSHHLNPERPRFVGECNLGNQANGAPNLVIFNHV